MPVDIESFSQPSTDNPELWSKRSVERVGSASFKKIRIGPAGTADHDLRLDLKPRTWQALGAALIPGRKDSADDRLTVLVDYTTQGRPPRTLSMEVPVRFVPYPPYLLLVTVIGVLLGSLIPMADKDLTWARRWQILATAVIVALTVEMLAQVLKSNNSELRVIGFEIDPFQIPSAALIGVFVGMSGSKAFEKFQSILDRFWKTGNAR